ncbi:MAG: 7-cyano-7-deazaguanine synthase QueC [Rickettsiaceae bacterium]|nr:7-cyano-7-deazaguanine synthase QueC [Rickettsiaceae bacterium]
MKKKAVVLVSGGLDSVTVLSIAKKEGYDIYPLSFLYSQRHKIELEKAAKSIASIGIENHKIIPIDLSIFGGSALTDTSIEVPTYESAASIKPHIPVTYVPARNTIFLSLASAYAEILGAHDIFIGIHALDSGNYPDCTREFIENFEKTANIGLGFTKNYKLRIRAPLIDMNKADIISAGISNGVDFTNTISCYNPTELGQSCGKCLACTIRQDGFNQLGMKDPAEYLK